MILLTPGVLNSVVQQNGVGGFATWFFICFEFQRKHTDAHPMFVSFMLREYMVAAFVGIIVYGCGFGGLGFMV